MKFNIKRNEVFSGFKLLPYFIKLKRSTTFCIDVSYGISNLKKCIIFMSLWRKAVKLWRFTIYFTLQPAAYN